MSGRFGQVLSRFVPMTEHDVQEILQEQSLSRRRFGDIALSWGLCRPDHIWRAWSVQLAHQPQRVNLDEVGIDTQSLALIDPITAAEYSVLPVRVLDDELIVATSEMSHERAAEALSHSLKLVTRFVFSEEQALQNAIRRYYAAA